MFLDYRLTVVTKNKEQQYIYCIVYCGSTVVACVWLTNSDINTV